MDERFQGRQRGRGSRGHDTGERRLDQWIETGRQLVDGVAGTRPGRRPASGSRPPMDLEKVGRWVGDKIDWLMDEEEDWRDPVEPTMRSERPEKSVRSEWPGPTTRKRPLDAISRRQAMAPVPESQSAMLGDGTWPDDDSFRVERWSRSEPQSPSGAGLLGSEESGQSQPRGPSRRPMPRSNRRRD